MDNEPKEESIIDVIKEGTNPEWDGSFEIAHSWIDELFNDAERRHKEGEDPCKSSKG